MPLCKEIQFKMPLLSVYTLGCDQFTCSRFTWMQRIQSFSSGEVYTVIIIHSLIKMCLNIGATSSILETMFIQYNGVFNLPDSKASGLLSAYWGHS